MKVNQDLENAYCRYVVNNLKEPSLIIVHKNQLKKLKKDFKNFIGKEKLCKGEFKLFGVRLISSKELKRKEIIIL